MEPAPALQPHHLSPRDGGNCGNTGNAFLDAIQCGSNQEIGGQAVLSSLILSLAVSTGLGLLFCVLRPRNNVVYAPRAKYADTKHAPPPINKGFLGWLGPVLKIREAEMIERVGLDAVIFLRVCRMFRNMFAALSVVGCGILIPVNVIAAYRTHFFDNKGNFASQANNFFQVLSAQFLYQEKSFGWAYVISAYLFDIIICFFLWTNYRVVTRLRRNYLDSPEYQNSLHARTLLLTDIPKELRSDDGIARITEEVGVASSMPRPAIARNVKDLPDLVEEHEETVKKLEKVLAKYLRDPNKLPAKRPVCSVSSKDKSYSKGQKVDAIDYLTSRIRQLEIEVKQVRETVDKRNALSFGFASYQEVSEAHDVAYATRKKAPHDSTVMLAPTPNDLIWKNLKMLRSERKWQSFINGVWITLLTVLFIVPNILIAVFLSNLGNLGNVWPAFKDQLAAHPTLWAIVQGILAPAITMLFYIFLPIIFRRLRIKAGDVTKTSRERHVTRALYSFFVLNQFVVVTFLSVFWGYITTIIGGVKITDINFAAKLELQLSQMAPYWVSYMLQRNLGSATDLAQLLRLSFGSFQRHFMSPTPREQIQASAPQPFDYASYYNYFLYYATISLVLAAVNPLLLPIATVYFFMDSFVKKYLLLYIFITKHESGGMYWRTVYNRCLFFTILGNLLIAATIASFGFFRTYWPMLAALAPLPFLVMGFKWYCVVTFDDQMHYYSKGSSHRDSELPSGGDRKKQQRRDKLGVRFGNPVLYKPLITPMVSAKSQHLLKSIYSGRTSIDMDPFANASGYSDVYLDSMDSRQPGKQQPGGMGAAPFEIVDENNMDFEHFKNRAEFRDQAGGDGQLFGSAADDLHMRPGTPSSFMTGHTRTGTMDSTSTAAAAGGHHLRKESHPAFAGGGHFRDDSGASSVYYKDEMRSRSESRGSEATKIGHDAGGTEYPRGYHQTPSALREHSPAGSDFGGAGMRPDLLRQSSRDGLVAGQARMGTRGPSALGGGGGSGIVPAPTPGGYGHIRSGESPAQTPDAAVEDDYTSYDYFRRGRTMG